MVFAEQVVCRFWVCRGTSSKLWSGRGVPSQGEWFPPSARWGKTHGGEAVDVEVEDMHASEEDGSTRTVQRGRFVGRFGWEHFV